MANICSVTHPDYIREKARQLRVEKSLTIDEIAERLALSRTTIYHWVRDIPIERRRDRQTAGQRKRSARNAERCRRRRREAYEQGAAEFTALAQDPTFRDFVCMYIGEGYKRNRNKVAICNSDPVVVSLAHRWIDLTAVNRLFYAVQYHADQDPDRLQTFWGFRLGVDPSRIALQRKSNSNQLIGRMWRCRWGVLTVGSHDTLLRARLQAWIDLTKGSWTTGLDSARTGCGAAW